MGKIIRTEKVNNIQPREAEVRFFLRTENCYKDNVGLGRNLAWGKTEKIEKVEQDLRKRNRAELESIDRKDQSI